MIVWTLVVLGVFYACVLYFGIFTCSAQMSMFHMERRPRNTLIIMIIIITFSKWHSCAANHIAVVFSPCLVQRCS